MRPGDLAKATFGDQKIIMRSVIEWSDNNFLRVQQRTDEVEQDMLTTQSEQTAGLKQVDRHTAKIIEGVLSHSNSADNPNDRHLGLAPLLEKIMQPADIS